MATLNSIVTSVRSSIAPLLTKRTGIVLGVMILMRGIVTGVMTYMDNGFTSTFFADWLSLLAKMMFIMMPCALVAIKLLSELIKKLMPDAKDNLRTLVMVVIMVLGMESSMTFSTALSSVGTADISLFMQAWLKDLATALPVSLTTMIIMALAIKPRIKKYLGFEEQKVAS
ncbi:DUF2798 domain-containing protein [Vibrio sp. JC009]|uniref:DUF2798 domain-containing protein n=1 Tax=Vibrio sp. JC009 TaxID=2912314 RepID=UPI0023AF9078|nr:DUF2798 domain-containing protein [Vibrio sp. JC009]WED23030.1 DUF2798 domain-containing protein [Vibrio sp. JC009]